MDRLESLSINPLSAPGLMPGVLGALLVLFGGLLLLRSRRRTGAATAAAAASAPRVALALLLCLGYAGGLLGRGLPFWLVSAGFLFASILAFRLLDRDPGGAGAGRIAASSAAIALAAGLAIAHLFQDVFLVRLP